VYIHTYTSNSIQLDYESTCTGDARQHPLNSTGEEATHGEKHDRDDDGEDNHETCCAPTGFALVLVRGCELLGRAGRVDGDGGDV
jgi:hypothetical protein